MAANKKFVISSSEFGTIRSAEAKVNGWLNAGQLKKPMHKVKLYQVVETYDLKLKFVKRKK